MTDNALKCMFNGGTLPIGYIIDKEQLKSHYRGCLHKIYEDTP